MSVDPEELRRAMRQWATGVTVVATAHDGQRHGMTVSSFTSVSLEPPLVLVSLERGTATHDLVLEARNFSVSILPQGAQEISDRFAGRLDGPGDRFAGLDTITLETGAPVLANALSAFDCRVVATYRAGNHTVFIGQVLAVRRGIAGGPLVYYDRDYRNLSNSLADEATRRPADHPAES